MTSDVWHELEGVDLETATFPVRARVGETGIFIFRVKDGYRGVERACPHLKSSLADAILMAGDTVIRCSHHNFTFKLSNGKGINGPAYTLRVFDIKSEGGSVFGRAAN